MKRVCQVRVDILVDEGKFDSWTLARDVEEVVNENTDSYIAVGADCDYSWDEREYFGGHTYDEL